jgi:phage protein D
VVDQTIKDIVIPHVSQVGESDSNLLLRIARQYGAILKPADGRIVLATEAGGQTTSGVSLEISIGPADITSYRVKYGGKNQGVTKVKARVRNYQTGEDEEIEAEVEGAQFG